MVRLDLHVHSTASDGTLSGPALVELACSRGLSALAITDHDSVEALPSALEAAAGRDLLLIPGVELSTAMDGEDVHVLGYFVDPGSVRFARRLSALRDARRRRASDIVSALDRAGFPISLDEVERLADGGSVGRSHVARALVSRGHAQDTREAFKRFVGRTAPFYMPKPSASPEKTIRMILEAGGIPVLAHPGVNRIDDAIPILVEAGLQGIEAYHPEHTPAMTQRYVRMAEALGLLVTGGSDYHGPASPGVELGAMELPDHILPDLLEHARRDRPR